MKHEFGRFGGEDAAMNVSFGLFHPSKTRGIGGETVYFLKLLDKFQVLIVSRGEVSYGGKETGSEKESRRNGFLQIGGDVK